MDPRTTTGRAAERRSRAASAHRRPPVRRPAFYLGAAVAGALLVDVLAGAEPPVQADTAAAEPVSVAAQLGLSAQDGPLDVTEDLRPLEELAAGRSSREAAQTAAQQAQVAADQAELDRRAAEEAARVAAEAAAAEAAARAAAEATARRQAEEAAAAQRTAGTGAPAAAARAATSGSTSASAVARISNTAGSIRPQAQAAANAVVSNVPGAAGITLGGTRPSAADPGGHPSGLAVDYMVGSDSSLGDAIVEYHIAHWDELGVDYVIWEQRMLSSPSGSWKGMSDRGSATANHMDHPHVNYRG